MRGKHAAPRALNEQLIPQNQEISRAESALAASIARGTDSPEKQDKSVVIRAQKIMRSVKPMLSNEEIMLGKAKQANMFVAKSSNPMVTNVELRTGNFDTAKQPIE